jgi:hypothetical protein
VTEGELFVEVVYATPAEQPIVKLAFRAGMSAAQAVEASGLCERFPEIEGHPLALGVFGVRVGLDHVLEPGDRVEICRPLQTDPRDLRRELVAGGRVMGGKDEAARTKAAK